MLKLLLALSPMTCCAMPQNDAPAVEPEFEPAPPNPTALRITYTWNDYVDGEHQEIATEVVRLELADNMEEYLLNF
jgi:hypothetical protein